MRAFRTPAGYAAPLAGLHTTLQALSTPALGLSVAVVGGLAFALAGPAIALTESSSPSVGSAGLALWAVIAGVLTARRAPSRAVDVAIEGAR